MKRLKDLLIYAIPILFIACATSRNSSIIYSDNYDKQTDQTSVLIFPSQEFKIPGKWTNTGYNNVSGQLFFLGPDSTRIAIALMHWNKYEFSYNNPNVSKDNFVKRFYEWDANYLKERTNGNIKILIDNEEKNYLVWNLESEKHGNDYFLFGLKGETAYNINIKSEKWEVEKQIRFLELLFNQ